MISLNYDSTDPFNVTIPSHLFLIYEFYLYHNTHALSPKMFLSEYTQNVHIIYMLPKFLGLRNQRHLDLN
jgi:hypothetical protein